jgi:hypothetical protein
MICSDTPSELATSGFVIVTDELDLLTEKVSQCLLQRKRPGMTFLNAFSERFSVMHTGPNDTLAGIGSDRNNLNPPTVSR